MITVIVQRRFPHGERIREFAVSTTATSEGVYCVHAGLYDSVMDVLVEAFEGRLLPKYVEEMKHDLETKNEYRFDPSAAFGPLD